MTQPAALIVSQPAPGRACGTCALCCKVYDVPVLDKPAGQWCRHCKPGQGCGIWETRPDYCRAFYCLWMTEGWIGPEWRPELSKMVLTLEPVSRFLLAQVDPGNAGAWKKEPYYTQLKRWAAAAGAQKRLVIVYVNQRATVVLPDRDVDIGTVTPGDRVVMSERVTAHGVLIDVKKTSGDA